MDYATPAPISSHPAFAPAVGLWFAALLGLGLFVMPAEVHDLLAERSGLAALFPADATGRAVISAIAALIGFLLGLAVARRVARAHEIEVEDEAEDFAAPEDSVWLGQPRPADPAAEPERPYRMFNPREELDEQGIGERVPEPEPEPESQVEPEPLAEPEPEPAHGDALMEAWREEHGDFVEQTSEPPTAPETSDEPEYLSQPEYDPVAENVPPAEAATPAATDAPGDSSLAELTGRLARAIEAEKQRVVETTEEAETPAAPDPEPQANPQDDDPVIAFLRREAERTGGAAGGRPEQLGDPQSVLKNALDRLSRVGNPR